MTADDLARWRTVPSARFDIILIFIHCRIAERFSLHDRFWSHRQLPAPSEYRCDSLFHAGIYRSCANDIEQNALHRREHALPELAAYASNEVTITGYLADVDPIFQSCRVFIAPLRFGAGMKGKIGQALSYGLPVVTTPIGAEGMNLKNGSEAIIADGAREFVAALISVYNDSALWQRLSDRGFSHVSRHFTPEVVERKVHQAIKTLCDLN